MISKIFKQQTVVWFINLDMGSLLSLRDDVTEFFLHFLQVARISLIKVSKMGTFFEFEVSIISYCF